jgi:hypothetical protein
MINTTFAAALFVPPVHAAGLQELVPGYRQYIR